MLRGKEYPSERKFYVDDKTGAKITRLTGFPTVHNKLYFHINQFTPDSKTLVFSSYSDCERKSHRDIFKVNVDGMEMVQLTDNPNLSGEILSNDGKYLYYMDKGALMRVDINSYQEVLINKIGRIIGQAGCTSLTDDGRFFYGEADVENNRRVIFKFTTDGKSAEIMYENENITHTQVEPTEGKIVAFQNGPDDKHRNIWFMNSDGSDVRPLEFPYGNGHWMWVGDTKKVMSNLESQYWGISLYKEGDVAPEKIVSDGLTCWHASCSRDGKWMITDTNWPDTGLHIINIETKKHKLLCESLSSNCHPQWTHPHPSFSPDNKYVIFNSDVTGIPHIHLAEVPEELLKELSR